MRREQCPTENVRSEDLTLTFVFIKGAPGLFITDYYTITHKRKNKPVNTHGRTRRSRERRSRERASEVVERSERIIRHTPPRAALGGGRGLTLDQRTARHRSTHAAAAVAVPCRSPGSR